MDKPFDSVEMKRKGAEHVRELTKGMSREQELAFWAEQTRLLQEEQQRQAAKSGAGQRKSA